LNKIKSSSFVVEGNDDLVELIEGEGLVGGGFLVDEG
jgi:hypothetical protein